LVVPITLFFCFERFILETSFRSFGLRLFTILGNSAAFFFIVQFWAFRRMLLRADWAFIQSSFGPLAFRRRNFSASSLVRMFHFWWICFSLAHLPNAVLAD